MTEEEYYLECCRLAAMERADKYRQYSGRDSRIESPNIQIENLHLTKDNAWTDTGAVGSNPSGCGY